MRSSNYLAALVLFLLPTISVELLTGNTPLSAYLQPLPFIVMNIQYGAALLLIRETAVRWGKGFASVFVLAAGYGMVNEALGSKGFFDPHFYAVMGFGLENFGRWFGINVPWALNISIFHAVFSVIVPLVLVSAIFPGSNRWIGNKLYAALCIALIAVTAFVFINFSMPPFYYHYNEGPGPILLILALLAADILMAWKLPTSRPRKWQMRPHALMLFIFSAVYMFIFFIILPSQVQATTHSPHIYITYLLAACVAIPVWLIFKLPEPTPRGKVALAAGLLTPILLTSITAGPGGIAAFVIVLALILIALTRGGRSALPDMRSSRGFISLGLIVSLIIGLVILGLHLGSCLHNQQSP